MEGRIPMGLPMCSWMTPMEKKMVMGVAGAKEDDKILCIDRCL